jgi:hypothetical protein
MSKYFEKEEGEENLITLDYFLLLFKSVFFWKKMRFETIREALYTRRRQAFFGQLPPDMDTYKKIVKQ